MITKKYYDEKEAIAYLGLAPDFGHKLLKQAVETNAIAYVKPSPRKKMYAIEDLDAFVSTWQRFDLKATDK